MVIKKPQVPQSAVAKRKRRAGPTVTPSILRSLKRQSQKNLSSRASGGGGSLLSIQRNENSRLVKELVREALESIPASVPADIQIVEGVPGNAPEELMIVDDDLAPPDEDEEFIQVDPTTKELINTNIPYYLWPWREEPGTRILLGKRSVRDRFPSQAEFPIKRRQLSSLLPAEVIDQVVDQIPPISPDEAPIIINEPGVIVDLVEGVPSEADEPVRTLLVEGPSLPSALGKRSRDSSIFGEEEPQTKKILTSDDADRIRTLVSDLQTRIKKLSDEGRSVFESPSSTWERTKIQKIRDETLEKARERVKEIKEKKIRDQEVTKELAQWSPEELNLIFNPANLTPFLDEELDEPLLVRQTDVGIQEGHAKRPDYLVRWNPYNPRPYFYTYGETVPIRADRMVKWGMRNYGWPDIPVPGGVGTRSVNKIESQRIPGKFYTVYEDHYPIGARSGSDSKVPPYLKRHGLDRISMSCSCPDYQTKRRKYPAYACKHILASQMIPETFGR